MKISADSLLGSAQKINNKKKLEEGSLNKENKDVKTDSLELSGKLNSRIETIEKEVKEIQTSLTRNQIMRSGLDLIEESRAYGEKSSDILNNTTFEGSQILKEYLAGIATSDNVASGRIDIQNRINSDINRLTRVQVEVDNIIASDLTAGKKPENLLADINTLFGRSGTSAESFSNLNAEKVMQLIK